MEIEDDTRLSNNFESSCTIVDHCNSFFSSSPFHKDLSTRMVFEDSGIFSPSNGNNSPLPFSCILNKRNTPRTPINSTRRILKFKSAVKRPSRTTVLSNEENVEQLIESLQSSPLLIGGSAKRLRSSTFDNSTNTNDEDSFSEFFEDTPRSKKNKQTMINNSLTSRYKNDFEELCLIGSGNFGKVYKCENLTDHAVYAVKISEKQITSRLETKLKEVYALAALASHKHIVRYYSSWFECNIMHIQNEYCNGGSLADAIDEYRQKQAYFSESQLKTILLHVLRGLEYLHSVNLAHLDIKPANIFISRNDKASQINEECDENESIIYKIGDLGHTTSLSSTEIEEGDCRYLPFEILQDDFQDMTKADIFSLGLTVYEAGWGEEMPKNGSLWHDFRKIGLKFLERYSVDLNSLLNTMVEFEVCKRPSASDLCYHRVLDPGANQSKCELRKALSVERMKSRNYQRELEESLRKQILFRSVGSRGSKNRSSPIF